MTQDHDFPNDEAQKAYEKAEALIDRAIAERAKEISFSEHAFGRTIQEHLPQLDRLPDNMRRVEGLTWLDLSGTQITDSGLQPISRLVSLETLDLRGTRITDLGLRSVSRLGSLTSLGLRGTKITDLGLQSVSRLGPLEALDLSGTQISMTGLRTLASIDGFLQDSDGDFGYLFIDDTPALQDAGLRAVYEAKHDNIRKRTQKVLEYVRGWGGPVGELSEANTPKPSSTGPSVAPRTDGRLDYADRDRAIPSVTAEQSEIHAILFEDLIDLCFETPQNDNRYSKLGRGYARYVSALSQNPDSLIPFRFWKAGNDLRTYLRLEDKRAEDAEEGTPKLDTDRLAGLEGLVAVHNTYVAIRPDLAIWDERRIDPVDRERIETNREQFAQLAVTFEAQFALVVDELRNDIRSLWDEAQGDNRAAERAAKIEEDVLREMITQIIIEALKEQKGEGILSKIGGDIRSTAVGAAAGAVGAAAMGPEAAATYSQLLTVLEPHLNTLLAAWHPGQDIKQTVDWIVARFKQSEGAE